MKRFLRLDLLVTALILLLLPDLMKGQTINMEYQNVTYTTSPNQICLDVYLSVGTSYPPGAGGQWTGMDLRFDMNVAGLIPSPGPVTLGVATYTFEDNTYLDAGNSSSTVNPFGAPPMGFEFEFGLNLKNSTQKVLPATPTLVASLCIPVSGGTLNVLGGDLLQPRTAITLAGSFWNNADATIPRRPFTFSAPTYPLPIELLTFEPRTNKCDVSLYWETASEKNFGYFQIEASKDGRNFKAVEQKKPESPNSSSLRTYKYPVPAAYQGYYFRLKAVDLDGAFEYSKTVYTESPCKKDYSVQLYPNPNYLSELTVEVNSPESRDQVQLFLVDNFGKRIREQKTDLKQGVNKVQLPVEDLPSGTYYIQIIGVEQLNQPLKFIRSNF